MGYHFHRHFEHLGEGEEYERKMPDRVILQRLLRYVLPYKKKLAITMLAIVITSITGVLGPYILGREIISKYIIPGNLAGLQLMGLIYLGILLINLISDSLRQYEIGWIGENTLFNMRTQLFSHLQNLSFSFFDRSDSGDLVSRVTNDTDAIGEAFISGTINLISDMLRMALILIFMFSISVPLSLVSMLVIPIIVLCTFAFQSKLKAAYKATRLKISKVTSRLEEGISGVREIQSFVRENDVMKEFRQANIENFQANLQASMVWGTFFPMIQFVQAVGTSIVILYGGMLALNGALGPTGVAIGDLVTFLLYVGMFFQPIMDLTNFYNTVQSALAASERIFELMDTPIEIKDRPDAIELPPVKGEIEFENFTFGYDPNYPVIHDVNFQIRPKETVALVGPTGAGKSTIIKILSRFYEPRSGCIKIDGYDIKYVTQESLRRQMGIVLQDTFLFNDTVMNNIRYGKLDATDEEVMNAAKMVGAHNFIMQLPEGYMTKVGERGSSLSIGQRQLVSFARALVRDPPILILDEATSSIDPYTEILIKRALRILLRDRTSIVIAHRLSTVRSAERIFVIDDGRIVEEGNHRELMKKGGLYRRLYEMQFREPEKLDEKALLTPETSTSREAKTR